MAEATAYDQCSMCWQELLLRPDQPSHVAAVTFDFRTIGTPYFIGSRYFVVFDTMRSLMNGDRSRKKSRSSKTERHKEQMQHYQKMQSFHEILPDQEMQCYQVMLGQQLINSIQEHYDIQEHRIDFS